MSNKHLTTEDWKRSHQEGVHFLKDAWEKDGLSPGRAERKAKDIQLKITNQARAEHESK